METTIILPIWLQLFIAALLLVSAILTLLGALGIIRFESFYLRMHPTAIVFTLGTWCVCIAVAVFFSMIDGILSLQTLIFALLIVVTMPITTVILARAVLFRWRNEGHPAPPALSYTIVPLDISSIPDTQSSEDVKSQEALTSEEKL